MSRRSLLNITSTKRSDAMATWIPTTPSNPLAGGALGDFNPPTSTVVTGTLFCPSARPLDNDGTVKDESAGRNATNTYSKGYKEVTTLRLVGADPWRIRRIVFSMKAMNEYLFALGGTPSAYYVNQSASLGMTRITNSLGGYYVALTDLVFKGREGLDWFSPFNAMMDTSRITLHSDRTWLINPPNQAGKALIKKNWYGTGKSLEYDDDESGSTEASSYFASKAKYGMGDLFIFDIYQGLGTSALTVNHEGRYYWHER